MKSPTKTLTGKSISLEGRQVKYNLVQSNGAQKLRLRIGPRGVDVLRPRNRSTRQVRDFLLANQKWIVSQLSRIENLKVVRRPSRARLEEFIFRGLPTRVEVVKSSRGGANAVVLDNDHVEILRGKTSQTQPSKSLEYWLRRQARKEITQELDLITRRLNVVVGKVFIMEQKTKWGNCSAKGNLSFNWRLILAPPFVLHYIVVHEATHLRVPDHSQRFWLTVQSLCPQAELAKQWLKSNIELLQCDLKQVCRKSVS